MQVSLAILHRLWYNRVVYSVFRNHLFNLNKSYIISIIFPKIIERTVQNARIDYSVERRFGTAAAYL